MWKVNQRVVSRTEPEFGVGLIESVSEQGTLKVYFPLAEETRQYGLRTAPLQRFALKVGDVFETETGDFDEVVEVKDDFGLLTYQGKNNSVPEWNISARLQDPGALQRIAQGEWSSARAFDLRKEAWELAGTAASTQVKGVVTARVQPLPHQLFITRTVVSRRKARAILADEVGLGKTIEAGLIMSMLRAQGRANRVLVVVPDALVFQWVEEMFRRFHLLFSVVDAARNKLEKENQGVSGFSSNQLVLTSMSSLASDPNMIKDACGDRWDLVVFDEAHHYRWSEENPSINWLMAKRLSENSEGALLLTATPRQYGLDTQFGLFQIADPQRFSDFDEFLYEAELDEKISAIAKELDKDGLSRDLETKVKELFPSDLQILRQSGSDEERVKHLLGKLAERHSFGGIVFRNRRAKLKGFPQRKLYPHPIQSEGKYVKALTEVDPSKLSELGLMDIATGRGSNRIEELEGVIDPKLKWIVEFVRKLKSGDKALVLCANVDKVETIALFLSSYDGIHYAVFHEDLSVLERDQQAASFASDNGASVLICSEIGGEGRNFQFAHKLVLGDLPRHPDLVEQRIGRLDRIGQKHEVEVHVPYLKNSPEEVLFRWYGEGLNSFESSWNGTDVFLQEFADDIFAGFAAFLPKGKDYHLKNKLLDRLVEDTQKFAVQVRKENESNVDILLDLNSFDHDSGAKLLEEVEDCDDDPSLEFFFRNILDFYGIEFDEYDNRGSLVVKGEALSFVQKFPGLSEDEDTVFTFDRELALVREDITFLTLDHPVTEAILGLLQERHEGIASVCQWNQSGRGQGILLEVSLVLQAQGPKHLELERFLPTKTLSILFDTNGKQVDIKVPDWNDLVDMKPNRVPFDVSNLKDQLKPMLETANTEAKNDLEKIRIHAGKTAEQQFQVVIDRLNYLKQVNPNIDSEEIVAWEEKSRLTIEAIAKARPRLDALRLIFTS